jgi:hypothetical protein
MYLQQKQRISELSDEPTKTKSLECEVKHGRKHQPHNRNVEELTLNDRSTPSAGGAGE